MFPRCFVFCALILAPPLTGGARSSANLGHVGRNIVIAADQTVHDAVCFLCSAEVDGHVTGGIHAFAGNVFVNGQVAGNIVIFGGNLTLTGTAAVHGQVLILGGHLRGDSAAMDHPPAVIAPIIFLPFILVICATIGGLIVLARRMVRGPVAYPPLPRL